MAIIAFALAPYYTGYIAAAVTTPSQPSINSTMPAVTETEAQANKTAIIEVEGMTCEGCAVHINETLKKLKGIVSAEANYSQKNVKSPLFSRLPPLSGKRAVNL